MKSKEDIEHIKDVIQIKKSRLRALEKKEARLGFDTDPATEMEIDEIKDELVELSLKLKRLTSPREPMTTKDFKEWLKQELNERNWQPSDLAKRAGVPTKLLLSLLNSNRRPGVEVSLVIAKALDVPPEDVFRLIGILPPASDST